MLFRSPSRSPSNPPTPTRSPTPSPTAARTPSQKQSATATHTGVQRVNACGVAFGVDITAGDSDEAIFTLALGLNAPIRDLYCGCLAEALGVRSANVRMVKLVYGDGSSFTTPLSSDSEGGGGGQSAMRAARARCAARACLAAAAPPATPPSPW